jgi:hypothetical protein
MVKICNNIPDKEMYDDIIGNIDRITDRMIEFSNYFQKLINISLDKKMTMRDKIKGLMKLNFMGNHLTKEQAREILKKMVISKNDSEKLIGKPITINIAEAHKYTGGDLEVDTNSDKSKQLVVYNPSQERMNDSVKMDELEQSKYSEVKRGLSDNLNKMKSWLPYYKDENIQNMVFRGVNTKYPMTNKEPTTSSGRAGSILQYIFFTLPMTIALKLIYILSGSPINPIKVTDFSEEIPFMYYILFLLSNVPIPVIGNIVNFFTMTYTIFRAIDDGRIYLAILSMISLFLSLFVLYSFDMGAIFKILYWLDVKHELNYKNQSSALSDMIGYTPTEVVTTGGSNKMKDNIEMTRKFKKENIEMMPLRRGGRVIMYKKRRKSHKNVSL